MHGNTKIYSNRTWKFQLTVPTHWRGPGFLTRLFRLDKNPEFYTPSGDGILKIAVGAAMGRSAAMSGHDDAASHLWQIARSLGHTVLATGRIEVLGRQHPTITYQAPASRGAGAKVLPQSSISAVTSPVFKNWHLLFDGIEYVFTAILGDAPELLPGFDVGETREWDSLVQSFKLLTDFDEIDDLINETRDFLDRSHQHDS